MNPAIKSVVGRSENLALKENVGERYRIMKNGINGSLWLELQQEAYRLKLTGDVNSVIGAFVTNHTGEKPTEDQGSPVWHLPFDGSMEEIVSELNRV